MSHITRDITKLWTTVTLTLTFFQVSVPLATSVTLGSWALIRFLLLQCCKIWNSLYQILGSLVRCLRSLVLKPTSSSFPSPLSFRTPAILLFFDLYRFSALARSSSTSVLMATSIHPVSFAFNKSLFRSFTTQVVYQLEPPHYFIFIELNSNLPWQPSTLSYLCSSDSSMLALQFSLVPFPSFTHLFLASAADSFYSSCVSN